MTRGWHCRCKSPHLDTGPGAHLGSGHGWENLTSALPGSWSPKASLVPAALVLHLWPAPPLLPALLCKGGRSLLLKTLQKPLEHCPAIITDIASAVHRNPHPGNQCHLPAWPQAPGDGKDPNSTICQCRRVALPPFHLQDKKCLSPVLIPWASIDRTPTPYQAGAESHAVRGTQALHWILRAASPEGTAAAPLSRLGSRGPERFLAHSAGARRGWVPRGSACDTSGVVRPLELPSEF